MDRFITLNNGGLPFVLNDFRWFLGQIVAGNEGLYQALDNHLRGFGDNFIVQGVVTSGTTPNIAITEGWIMLDGELLKVDAQTGIDTTSEDSFTKVSTFDTTGNKTFRNAANIDTYEKNRGVVNVLAGSLAFNGFTINNLSTVAATDTGEKPIVRKVIDIGAWNMDTTPSITVAHNLTAAQFDKVRRVDALIQDDAEVNRSPLNTFFDQSAIQGGVELIDATNVSMERLTGGLFDSVSYNDVSGVPAFNRGWINIEYEL